MNPCCSSFLERVQMTNTPRVSGPQRVLTGPTCKEVEMADDRVCAIAGCRKPVKARGWCAAHYSRWQTHGDPMGSAPRREGAIDVWVRTVAIGYSGDDCLIWPFFRGAKGYAFWTVGGRPRPAARAICELVHGKPPSGEHVAAHNCFMGASGCVNPRHIRWATASENERDKIASGTSNRGARHGMSKLTEADVLAIRSLQGKLTQAEIAERFGVSKWTVGDIIRRERWGWLA